ncbi:hypothetical protein EV643_1489 [Kribbella sp. VKM Ac-2527]|uniref:Uncharacterized protein n=2 Tax=Kribbella caucasensis TaxID=2512215 RepID=A0A4V3C5E4_9ACTN|nr:hypothetical protein EV643_1489 [Kribbella sp. VKM Ac-2527]
MVLTHVLECLKGLLMGRILIGHEGEQPILVIPTSEDTYLVKRFQFRKKWWQLFDSSESKEVRKDQLPKGLVPLE